VLARSGGNCVEMTADEERLTIDVGRPLEEIIELTTTRESDGTVATTGRDLEPPTRQWLRGSKRAAFQTHAAAGRVQHLHGRLGLGPRGAPHRRTGQGGGDALPGTYRNPLGGDAAEIRWPETRGATGRSQPPTPRPTRSDGVIGSRARATVASPCHAREQMPRGGA
jgi:hypothetical protein